MSEPVTVIEPATPDSQAKRNTAAINAWNNNLTPIFVGCATERRNDEVLSNKKATTSLNYIY